MEGNDCVLRYTDVERMRNSTKKGKDKQLWGPKPEPQKSHLRKGMPNWSTVTFRVISLGLDLALNILGRRDGPVGTATEQRAKRSGVQIPAGA